jgi:hypothetical protein
MQRTKPLIAIKTIIDQKYVKYINSTSCMDCKYLVKPENKYANLSNSHCLRFGKQNFVTGEIDLYYANVAREHGPCGPNALYKKINDYKHNTNDCKHNTNDCKHNTNNCKHNTNNCKHNTNDCNHKLTNYEQINFFVDI